MGMTKFCLGCGSWTDVQTKRFGVTYIDHSLIFNWDSPWKLMKTIWPEAATFCNKLRNSLAHGPRVCFREGVHRERLSRKRFEAADGNKPALASVLCIIYSS